MDIVPFIHELILLNECVILRGIGGFETSYKHARIDKRHKRITPPSKQIHFRPDWINDNSVLLNHLENILDLDKSIANQLIDEFVQNFYAELKEKGSIILEEIGEFSFDERQVIQFKEFEGANYLGDSFGLDILEMEAEKKKVEKPKVEALSPVGQTKRKMTSWYVSIGVLIIGVSVTFIILLSKGSGQKIFSIPIRKANNNPEILVFGAKDTLQNDPLMQSIEKTLDTKTSAREALTFKEQPKVQPPKVDVEVTESNELKYFLVAGSFRTNRNANVLKDQLIHEGFSPEVVNMNGNYRVIVGKFADRKPAITELRRMRTQLDQSVWLLESQDYPPSL